METPTSNPDTELEQRTQEIIEEAGARGADAAEMDRLLEGGAEFQAEAEQRARVMEWVRERMETAQ